MGLSGELAAGRVAPMSYILLEYVCRLGHRTESLERRSAVSRSVPCGDCGGRARRCISPVRYKRVWGSAANRGKSDPPPVPTAMDSVTAMGEGQTADEWRAGRAKVWAEADRKKRRKAGAPI